MGFEVVFSMLNPMNLIFTPDGSFRIIETGFLIGGIWFYWKFIMPRHSKNKNKGRGGEAQRSSQPSYTVR